MLVVSQEYHDSFPPASGYEEIQRSFVLWNDDVHDNQTELSSRAIETGDLPESDRDPQLVDRWGSCLEIIHIAAWFNCSYVSHHNWETLL